MTTHTCDYRILYRDTDTMGVLYYGRYLELFELGRTEWQRAEGLKYREMEKLDGLMFPVIEAGCQYQRPLPFDELAVISTQVATWTPTRLGFSHEIHRSSDGILCATGFVTLGCVRSSDWRPKAMPPRYLELLGAKFADLRVKNRLSS